MYASVTTSMYGDDRMIDAVRDLRIQSTEQERMKGFRGFLFLLDHAMGKGIALALWDTEDDLLAAETSDASERQSGDQTPHAQGQPERDIYEVVVDEWVDQGAAKAARMTTRTMRIDKVDEAINIMHGSIVPAARQQKAWRGMLSLANRRTGKTATLSFWESESVLKASETGGYYREQVAKTTPVSAGQPTREIYEVIIQVLAPAPAAQPQAESHALHP